jgi:hypothetical protein
MCFSAGASFGASVILGTIGVVSLNKTKKPSQLMFAGIPMLFAVQQFVEGTLWLSLTHASFHSWQNITTYLFLLIAQGIWPFWIPVSMFLIETQKTRRIILLFVSALGLITSVLLICRLFTFPVFSEISSRHIYYGIESPRGLVLLSSIFYVAATVTPSFISGIKRMMILGTLLTVSLIISKVFYEEYLISVWCFVAALLSIIIVFIMNPVRISALNGMQAK